MTQKTPEQHAATRINFVYGQHAISVSGIVKQMSYPNDHFAITEIDIITGKKIVFEWTSEVVIGRKAYQSGDLVQVTGHIAWSGNNDPYSSDLSIKLRDVTVSVVGFFTKYDANE